MVREDMYLDDGGSRATAPVPGPSPALSRRVAVPPAPFGPARARAAQAVVRHAAARLPFSVTSPGAPDQGSGKPGQPVLLLRRPGAVYRRLGARGLVGFGEAYQAGDWDTDDLAGLLTVLVTGVDTIVPVPLQRIRGHAVAPHRPRAEEQTVSGARRNARHHYALPDDLFRAFLDETMCYSSAIFPVGDDGEVLADWDGLADAQRTKLDRLLDLAGVRDGSRVLEIGTGWGELAVRAARRGAEVHAVTNMTEHVAYASDRAARAGVSDKVRVDQLDYRELTAKDGGYDAILSVEMIEAVGRSYWPVYFRTLEGLLAPQGRIALQAMTMPHDRMLRTSRTYTWIDKYIFPGGLIPSLEGIDQALTGTGLRVLDRSSFGPHYRATLSLWRERFNQNWDQVAGLGFNEEFRRTWNFYLAISEAGFAADYLNVHQFLIARP